MNEHVTVTHTGNYFNQKKKKKKKKRRLQKYFIENKMLLSGSKETQAGCSSPSDVAYGETLGEVVAMESHDGGGSPRWREGERGVLLR